VLYQITQLVRRDGRILIRARHLRPDPRVLWQLVRLSAAGILQLLISTTSWVGLVRVLSVFGSSVLAGYTIGLRVIIFALLPSWGLSNAAATLVGQNLGAKKPERAEQAVWMAARYNTWVLGQFTGLGPRGVFAAITIAFSALALASAWIFRRGRWKSQTV